MSFRNVKYCFFVFVAILIPSQAMAAGVDRPTTAALPNNERSQPTTTGSDRQQEQDAQVIARLKERGGKEIDRRVVGLNHLLGKINRMKKLTVEQKTAFNNQINQEIDALNNLKTKIEADGDLQVLRTDVRSVVDSYRVFALFMPQINILDTADRAIDISEQLNTLAGKLQSRISDAEQGGMDVSDLKTQLADMQAKVADAQTMSQNAEGAVIDLDPSGYPGNRSSLQTGWNDLKAARQDIADAAADAKNIIAGLKKPGDDASVTSTGSTATT